MTDAARRTIPDRPSLDGLEDGSIDAREQPVLRLQHRDPLAEPVQHRRRLQPDIPAADHDHALRSG